MPLISCRFVHTGGRVFFFWGSNGSIISHSLSVKSLEYPISYPTSLTFTHSTLILCDHIKDLKWVLYCTISKRDRSISRIAAWGRVVKFEGLGLVLEIFGWVGLARIFALSMVLMSTSWYERKLLARSLGTVSFCMQSDLGYWLKFNLRGCLKRVG